MKIFSIFVAFLENMNFNSNESGPLLVIHGYNPVLLPWYHKKISLSDGKSWNSAK